MSWCTHAGWHTANMERMKKKKTALSDYERDSLLTHLKLVPTKKYFLPVTKNFWEKDQPCTKLLQIHLKFLCKLRLSGVHTELDDEVQTGEKECMKNSIAQTIPRMAKPPGLMYIYHVNF